MSGEVGEVQLGATNLAQSVYLLTPRSWDRFPDSCRVLRTREPRIGVFSYSVHLYSVRHFLVVINFCRFDLH